VNRRRLWIALAALTAWTVGGALGTTPPAPQPARAGAPVTIGAARDRANFLPSLTGTKPIFVLALGSDSRSAEPNHVAHGHSDVMQLIGINPQQHKATILGFHRDTWLHIPGHDTTRLNTAMVEGGPQLTIKTFEAVTHIPIDYYLLTSFKGWPDMVNAIGGVFVDVPYPMHDPYSKANFDRGYQRLNGHSALAFARDRHDTPDGVYSRTLNQSRLLQALLTEFQRQFQDDPETLFKWLAAGIPNVQTDVPFSELMNLALTALSIPPANVNRVLVPTHSGTEGTASVAFLTQPQANKAFTDFRQDGLLDYQTKG
jgi:LCP family protein required for cell wall assembly